MIPVRGYHGAKVAVLGLGRSGLATAHALRAGGAEVLCWDDNAAPREAAQAISMKLLGDKKKIESLSLRNWIADGWNVVDVFASSEFAARLARP